MSQDVAYAYFNLQIERISTSPTPAADRSFVCGALDFAEFISQLSYQEAECYREVLAIKAGHRVVQLRRATA